MNPEQYQAFTEALRTNLERDERVIGLLAVGSMAATHHQPDQWSDHDFAVIVTSDAELFRTDLHWLPEQDQIVLAFRETDHGLKVVYRSGHLLEFAIFDPEELNFMRINTCRILIDRSNMAQRVEDLRAITTVQGQQSYHDDEHQIGQFLTNLLVGTGRYARGEHLSGHWLVKVGALHHLAKLIGHNLPPQRDVLDNLDPVRRFEFAYPAIGADLNLILLLPVPEAACAMLDLVEGLFADLPAYPAEAVAVIRQQIRVCSRLDGAASLRTHAGKQHPYAPSSGAKTGLLGESRADRMVPGAAYRASSALRSSIAARTSVSAAG